jgi:DNA helicase-2/ATP-dependent DNA helicase PcrA
VFVLNTVDGCIPSDLSVRTPPEIEEERRLLYVAMTRAKDQLHLMVPQRFFVHQQRHHGDRHVYGQRTRFIPPAILKHFDVRSWPPASAERSAAKPAAGSADVRGRLRRMWG